MESTYQGIKFTDADIVEPDDYIPDGEYNPHGVRPWLLHDHGTALCVVFASNLQDAFDTAVDAGKLDHLMIAESEYDDYGVNSDEPTCDFLGNASEPFDIDDVRAVELPNPPFSWCAIFNAHQHPNVGA